MKRSMVLTVTAILCLLAAACGTSSNSNDSSPAASGGKEARIVLLMSTTKTQGDYASANYKAFAAMSGITHAKLEVAENTAYDQAVQVMRRYGSEGYDAVIAESSAYDDAVLQVAPDFPNTWFIVVSDLPSTKGLPNVAAWRVPWAQMGYVDAAIGCLATTTGKVGMVNSLPIPAFEEWAGGAELGTEHVCGSKDAFKTAWTNDLNDVAKAKSTANALHAEGADVIFDAADTAGAGIFAAAKQGGFLTIGKYVDQSQLAPQSVITSLVIDFDDAYKQLATLFESKKLKAKIYPASFHPVTPFKNVDSSVQAKAMDIYKQVRDGSIDVPYDVKVTP